jgi:hypothetical protein
MARLLTPGEKHLLKPVFQNTLNYHSISCDSNKANIGGEGNSITPAGMPYMSQKFYCEDFASKETEAFPQWVFVHEIGHVWQWQHGRYPVNEAIGVYVSKAGNYQQAYPYDLMPGKDLMEYNFEQQASIIADYWALLTKRLQPQYNNKIGQAILSDYTEVIAQLHHSGPPDSHLDLPM